MFSRQLKKGHRVILSSTHGQFDLSTNGQELIVAPEKKIARIRTSDRIAFKRCRQKWDWSSGLRNNLQQKENRMPLWFGSGFHFAMEDYHGYNRYGNPKEAFHAYVDACRKTPLARLPVDWQDSIKLADAMLDYYVSWLDGKNTLRTLWIDGVPQVECRFEIEIPLDPEYVKACGYDEVRYQGTIDRVCVDEKDRIFLMDYKTAKKFSTTHFDIDPQIGAYLWAGSVLFDRPVEGFVYSQHLKAIPEMPVPLASGELSVNKSQTTTHQLYRKKLIEIHGSVQLAPQKNREFLNYLAATEQAEQDAYVRRDYDYRNEDEIAFEGSQILAEAYDMINPNLPIYVNSTRDCTWDCDFKGTCLMKRSGDNYQEDLDTMTMQRDDQEDNWRKHLA